MPPTATLLPLLLLATPSPSQPPVAEPLSAWKLVETCPLQGPLHHVQGIDIEGSTLWVSSVDAPRGKGYLTRFTLPAGRLDLQVEVQQGPRIHPGGITLDGDSIWVPVAEYHRRGSSSIQRRDKRTLALISTFDVDDHIGCVAVAPDALWGGNWDSRTLYRWSRQGRELARLPNPHPTAYQDLKFIDGLLIASGNLSRTEGAIEWLAPTDLRLVSRLTAGVTSRGVPYTHEGMTLRSGKLYLLPEDDPSRLFVFSPR